MKILEICAKSNLICPKSNLGFMAQVIDNVDSRIIIDNITSGYWSYWLLGRLSIFWMPDQVEIRIGIECSQT